MSAIEKAAKLVGAIIIDERHYGTRARWLAEFPAVITPSRIQAWTDDELCGAILDALAGAGRAPYLGRLPDGWSAAAMHGDPTKVVEARGNETRLAALLALVEALPGGEG